MPRLFPARQASDVPVQWADDPKYQAAVARLAAVKQELTERRNRLAPLANEIAAIGHEVERCELEVLAGEASDAALAGVQQRHLEKRVASAKEQLAIEKLTAEQARLEDETVPSTRQAAKEASVKAIRKLYRAQLVAIQAGLAAAVEADAKLNALIGDAERQFKPFDGNAFSDVDPDGFPRAAALWAVSRNIFDLSSGGIVGRRSVQGNTASFLDTIDKALDALDADEATASANGTARKREQDGTIKQPPAVNNRGLA